MPEPTSTGSDPAEPGRMEAAVAARLLAAIADPTRMTIVRALTVGTACVFDLQSQLPIAPNLLSYHLKVLRDADLIVSSRRSRWMDYSLKDGALDRLRAALPTA